MIGIYYWRHKVMQKLWRVFQTFGRDADGEKEFMACYPWRWKQRLSGCPSEVKESVTTAVLVLFKFNTEPQEKNTAPVTFDPSCRLWQRSTTAAHTLVLFTLRINKPVPRVCVCVYLCVDRSYFSSWTALCLWSHRTNREWIKMIYVLF